MGKQEEILELIQSFSRAAEDINATSPYICVEDLFNSRRGLQFFSKTYTLDDEERCLTSFLKDITCLLSSPEEQDIKNLKSRDYARIVYEILIVKPYFNASLASVLSRLLQSGSEVLLNLKLGLLEGFSNSIINDHNRNDEGDKFQSISQERQRTSLIVEAFKKGKYISSPYDFVGRFMKQVSETKEKENVKDSTRNSSIVRHDLKRENSDCKGTTSKLVEADHANIPLGSIAQLKVSDKESDTTPDFVGAAGRNFHPEPSDNVKENDKEEDITTRSVDDSDKAVPLESDDTTAKWTERVAKDKDDTTAKWTEVSLDLDGSEDLNLRRSIETTSDDSSTVETASSGYTDETVRQLLFEWLRGQSWATSFYLKRNEITIHAKDGVISVSQIDRQISHQFPKLRHPYRVLFSNPGVCLPCVHPDNMTDGGKVITTPSEEKIIKPGQEISCHHVLGGNGNVGTLSGQICDLGLTAGHIVRTSDLEKNKICMGTCKLGGLLALFKTVNALIPGTASTRTITADILFFWMTDQCRFWNLFEADLFGTGVIGRYSIALHRGLVAENANVIVILRDGTFQRGKVTITDYYNSEVSSTFYIVDDNNRAITVGGDSGALVVLHPSQGDCILKAIGVVTHVHWKLKPEFEGVVDIEPNAENSTSSATIAIRLYDVLVAAQQSAEWKDKEDLKRIGLCPDRIEFSGQQAEGEDVDSGIQA